MPLSRSILFNLPLHALRQVAHSCPLPASLLSSSAAEAAAVLFALAALLLDSPLPNTMLSDPSMHPVAATSCPVSLLSEAAGKVPWSVPTLISPPSHVRGEYPPEGSSSRVLLTASGLVSLESVCWAASILLLAWEPSSSWSSTLGACRPPYFASRPGHRKACLAHTGPQRYKGC